jgi:hypothetical protein
LPPRAEGFGQVAGQGLVELPLQGGEVREHRPQGQARGLVGGSLAQSLAGIGQRGDACSGVEQERQQESGAALGSMFAEFQVGLQEGRGVLVDVRRGQRILNWAHGFLLR